MPPPLTPPAFPLSPGLPVTRYAAAYASSVTVAGISPMGPVKGAGPSPSRGLAMHEKRDVVGALVAEQSRGQVAGAWDSGGPRLSLLSPQPEASPR